MSLEYLEKMKAKILKENNMENIVYIIYNPLTKLHKIGYTTQFFARRFNLIQSQSGMLLKVRRVYQPKLGNPRGIERQLHEMFDEKRKIGEWFSLCDDDINRIDVNFKNTITRVD